MNNIVLSVLVPTYGHEKYIGQALDSILKQETDFDYEIIIGEDASPDNTRSILEMYEERYPNRFIIIYRDINAGGYGNGNCIDLIKRAKGKYICFLEGDDYIVSNHKFQEQVTFLEQNENYIAVSCNTIMVDGFSKPIDCLYPECKDEEYTLKHFRKGILPGQTACLIYRTLAYKKIFDDKIWESNPVPADKIVYLTVASMGKIFCIQKKMIAYRYIVKDGTSYSANVNLKDFKKNIEWYKNLINYARRLGNKEAEIAAEGSFFAVLFYDGIKKNRIGFKEFIGYLSMIKYKNKVLFVKFFDYLENKMKRGIKNE